LNKKEGKTKEKERKIKKNYQGGGLSDPTWPVPVVQGLKNKGGGPESTKATGKQWKKTINREKSGRKENTSQASSFSHVGEGPQGQAGKGKKGKRRPREKRGWAPRNTRFNVEDTGLKHTRFRT